MAQTVVGMRIDQSGKCSAVRVPNARASLSQWVSRAFPGIDGRRGMVTIALPGMLLDCWYDEDLVDKGLPVNALATEFFHALSDLRTDGVTKESLAGHVFMGTIK